MTSTIVNSHNEWDPCEEVIVGLSSAAAEPSTAVDPVWRYLADPGESKLCKTGPYPPKIVEQAQRELDNLTRVLQSENLTVKRPTPIDFEKPIQTPNWAVPNGYTCTCPRDVLVVVGNEIIEAPMTVRSRFFEYQCYRPLIHDYFKRGARWTTAPKGILADNLFDDNYPLLKDSPDRAEAIKTHKYLIKDWTEPVFDAADYMRCGKDIFIQRSFVTNDFGIEWSRRHLEPQGYRVHTLHSADLCPKHIDSSLIPLSAGVLLENPHRKMEERQMLLDNGWTIHAAPEPADNWHTEWTSSVMRPCSPWVGMNVFSVNEKTVTCSAQETELIKLLETLGFRVLQIPFSAMYYLGGGFHCATVDVRRRSTFESYFPLLDKAEQKKEEESKYTTTIGK
eukprot:TRINITY_DN68101_c1_g1_i1.p1 TRINITY_DN68101_c1_g1~~TRINITY_DN68101_c1_g1_i1.p1  ORF type:complete len:393 (-),score=38.15 TRINITY_DN68101_c1_g1_i1:189-1367(-)